MAATNCAVACARLVSKPLGRRARAARGTVVSNLDAVAHLGRAPQADAQALSGRRLPTSCPAAAVHKRPEEGDSLRAAAGGASAPRRACAASHALRLRDHCAGAAPQMFAQRAWIVTQNPTCWPRPGSSRPAARRSVTRPAPPRHPRARPHPGPFAASSGSEAAGKRPGPEAALSRTGQSWSDCLQRAHSCRGVNAAWRRKDRRPDARSHLMCSSAKSPDCR
jgi:hypothetical protein